MATHVNCVQVQLLADCIRELELQLLDLGFFQENQSFIEKCSKVVTSKIQEWVGDHKGDNDPPVAIPIQNRYTLFYTVMGMTRLGEQQSVCGTRHLSWGDGPNRDSMAAIETPGCCVASLVQGSRMSRSSCTKF